MIARMVNDHTLGDNQEVMLKSYAGIGFTPENDVIVAKALELADEKQISISLSQKLRK
jgi:hypothetical protein